MTRWTNIYVLWRHTDNYTVSLQVEVVDGDYVVATPLPPVEPEEAQDETIPPPQVTSCVPMRDVITTIIPSCVYFSLFMFRSPFFSSFQIVYWGKSKNATRLAKNAIASTKKRVFRKITILCHLCSHNWCLYFIQYVIFLITWSLITWLFLNKWIKTT